MAVLRGGDRHALCSSHDGSLGGDMRVVYEAENVIDAHLVKNLLENVGIPAWVRGEFLTGGIGELPTQGLVAVAVPDSAEADARAELASWQSGSDALGGAADAAAPDIDGADATVSAPASARPRSEQPRVGKECVSTCTSRWSAAH